ncbi:MAG: DUF86 domain-containing protein [Phycisphaerales bacterium]|nr:DUF86 domain-containing protein [Phycisphaerales bacterium]
MSKRDDRVSLHDMFSHASEAVQLLGSASRDDLRCNRMMQLALTRLVEIIGEAATRVSIATKEANPDIPWPQIIGMRNRLIHGYDVTDWDLPWDTVTTDLPPLINSIKRIGIGHNP